MTEESKRFYTRLGVGVAAVIVVMLVARLLFFTGGRSGGDADRPSRQESSTSSAKVISWRDVAQHYGGYCTVEGTIVATHNSGKACFLNFHSDWKKHFTAVIFANRFSAFPSNPEDYYQGKQVRVTGTIKKYEGRPEIVLESPSQIEEVQ